MLRQRVLFVIGSLLTTPAFADPGVWAAQDNFTKINVACFRVYVCTPGTAVIFSSDEQIVKTPNTQQTGICTIGEAGQACGGCITTPPTTACEWNVVKK